MCGTESLYSLLLFVYFFFLFIFQVVRILRMAESPSFSLIPLFKCLALEANENHKIFSYYTYTIFTYIIKSRVLIFKGKGRVWTFSLFLCKIYVIIVLEHNATNIISSTTCVPRFRAKKSDGEQNERKLWFINCVIIWVTTSINAFLMPF